MRIFLAGGTGAIGRRLVPLLVAAGHHVTATTTSPARAGSLQALGAEPVVADGLDEQVIRRAVRASSPEVVVHQMTAIPSLRSLRNFDRKFELTNRLRTEGTRYLLAAARESGARIFVAQSFGGWPYERRGGRVKTEADPLDPNPPRAIARTHAAIRRLEQMVSAADGLTGIVLRYGGFYGPGTSVSENGEIVDALRQRMFPLVGDGAGVWSFIHIEDAARATLAAIEKGLPGIYNIVDDEPAEVAAWLPELARAVGARPPRRIPVWLARLIAGELTVVMMTQIRGSSNQKARETLGWRPVYASWRDGFHRGLSDDRQHPVAAKAV